MKYPKVKIVRPRNRPNWEIIILAGTFCLLIGVVLGYGWAQKSIWSWGIEREMTEIRLTIKEIPLQSMRLEAIIQEIESWKTEMVKIGIFVKGQKEMMIHLPVDDSGEEERK